MGYFACSVHVVFGEVVSGHNVVSHIESLPVDRMSRPLQDAKVVNCGELVLKTKASKCLSRIFISQVQEIRC